MTDLAQLFSVRGKTAIVTGASYGLGAFFARVLADGGANLVLAARSAERIEELRQAITKPGGAAESVACDVGDPAQVARLVARAIERFGRIDIMINNAGVAAEAGMVPERIPDEAFEQTVRVNLLGTWYGCREAGARMLADGNGGSIINIASIAGLSGVPNFPSAYQATKAAVINLTRNLAASWADRGVRVNALAPGWFPSEMTADFLAVPAFLKWTISMAPMGRIGRLEELVGPLLFLASDASSFVTGHTLVVDGGISATTGMGSQPDELIQIFAQCTPGDRGKRIRPTSETAAD